MKLIPGKYYWWKVRGNLFSIGPYLIKTKDSTYFYWFSRMDQRVYCSGTDEDDVFIPATKITLLFYGHLKNVLDER